MQRTEDATNALHTAFVQFRRNASANHYVALERAMLAYQDATKNAPRATAPQTPRQYIIENASTRLACYSPFAPLADVHSTIRNLAEEDATIRAYYDALSDTQLAALIRMVQRATDARNADARIARERATAY